MKRNFHRVAGGLALCLIVFFWGSTLVAELFLSQAAVFTVKQMILYGLLGLIPLMAMTAGSGFSLASSLGRHGVIPELEVKKKRMRVLGANGLLVLLPAAFFLFHKAASGEFDGAFYGVQGVELLAGGLQVTLMLLNIRDGIKMSRRGLLVQQ